MVYAVPEGGSLVFSSARDGAPSAVGNVSWERRHVGLTVSTRAELERWLQRLKESDVPHQLIDDDRVYFSDPDGLVLELEVATPTPVNPAASALLARWRCD